jgi:hypothetical protein
VHGIAVRGGGAGEKRPVDVEQEEPHAR